MVEVKHLKLEAADADEKDIQAAFERELSELDDSGLRHVGSFFHIGTGFVDCIAVDDDGNPVLIEFKKPGAFDRDAVFQLMNYYGWFASDENHLRHLRDYVAKALPGVLSPTDELGSGDIRLIAVVSELSDEIKSACYAIRPSVKVIQYRLGKLLLDGSIRVVITSVFDPEEEAQAQVKAPKDLDAHFKSAAIRELFNELMAKVREVTDLRVEVRSLLYYINFVAPGGRGFLGVHARKGKLQLDARGTISLSGFKPWKWPTSWGAPGTGGSIGISSSAEITPALLEWIKGSFASA